MTRKTIILMASALTLIMIMATVAGADRMDIRKPAYDQVLKYENEKYSVKDDIQIGQLDKGDSYYFNSQLTTGIDYFIHFQGDVGVKKLVLVVYDENWNVVADNTGTTAPAVVHINPEWSGTYHVKATLADCEGESDFWFILAGYK